jgi:hypothetical protein
MRLTWNSFAPFAPYGNALNSGIFDCGAILCGLNAHGTVPKLLNEEQSRQIQLVETATALRERVLLAVGAEDDLGRGDQRVLALSSVLDSQLLIACCKNAETLELAVSFYNAGHLN